MVLANIIPATLSRASCHMQWADDIRIETPEQIDLSLEIAGLGSRFVAQVLDWVIKWGILSGISILAIVVAALLGASFNFQTTPILLIALVLGLFYAFLLGFDIILEVRGNGQTPGKKIAGIRVIREGGAPVDFQTAAIRNLLGLADFLPGFYMLGGFLVLLTARGQRVGDLAAGTIVIRERIQAPPADLQEELAHLPVAEFPFTAEQLERCSARDRFILRSFFQRRRQLERDARRRLTQQLASTFMDKLASATPDTILGDDQAESFLASLYQHLENWARHR
jgi:uncharacterized RDD family membrane protein YckC